MRDAARAIYLISCRLEICTTLDVMLRNVE